MDFNSIGALLGAVSIGMVLADWKNRLQSLAVVQNHVKEIVRIQDAWKEDLRKFAEINNALTTKVAEIDDRLGAHDFIIRNGTKKNGL